MRISDWSSDVCSSDLVSAMPSRFEKDALHTAAAILPRAIEVKAIDDCTVDGSKVRNRNPAAIVGSSRWSRPIPSPSSGKIRKVDVRKIGRASCRERVGQYV